VSTRTTPFDLSLAEIDGAAALIREVVPSTPTFRWPVLAQRLEVDLALKHENQTCLGTFKVRGGLTYVDALRRRAPQVQRLIAASAGNHGQSLALAGARAGLGVTIVVPRDCAQEKTAAMRALGAQIVEHGADFEASYVYARTLDAGDPTAEFVPSFHRDLVLGVATYARELFAAGPFDVVYVPIGLGSGITGLIAVRDLLRLPTEIVGVVSETYPAYALSLAAGVPRETAAAAPTIADGIGCRVPDPTAFAMIQAGAARIVTVSEAGIRAAMGWLFSDTHNVAEGAGAAAVAAVAAERALLGGRRVAAVVSGGNVDRAVFAAVLA
jgi:threonine dehydratase